MLCPRIVRVVTSKPRDSPLSLSGSFRVAPRIVVSHGVARRRRVAARCARRRRPSRARPENSMLFILCGSVCVLRMRTPHNIRSGTSCSDRVSAELAVMRVEDRVGRAASGLRAPSLRRAPGEARKLPAGSRLGTNTIGARPSALLSHRARPGDSHPRAIARKWQSPRRFGEPGRVESTTI